MKYALPAIFTKDGEYYCVNFPDFEGTNYGCFTQGKGIENALFMANDALCMTLYDMEVRGEKFPVAKELGDYKVGKDEFVQFVACDTDFYRRFYEKRAVKKNLTIPSYLASEAEAQNINFSAVLTEALSKKLKIATR
ncbi:MAG: type II toxin-antitoxin system HicB family antitoxin [Christensenellaceae bacterium]|jgi:predicted RNase H-like HicB family nuclease|nr:type II toxin-antitoxin system HicB family antitoxin [Christensenellaceae bacterium]